jgi:peptide/nickel transport system permease protein
MSDLSLEPAPPPASKLVLVLNRYWLSWLGGAILLAWLVMALFAPFIAPHDPNLPDMANRLLPPSAAYPLGTDALGRDLLSRVIHGTRLTLLSSFTVIVIGAAIGTLFGAVAAYVGGWVDDAMMRLTDLVMCFPPIILAMAIAASLGVVPPTAEWGAMVAEGREFIQQWWIATFPGLAILTVVIAFNFVGDGVRDWLDPRGSTL